MMMLALDWASTSYRTIGIRFSAWLAAAITGHEIMQMSLFSEKRKCNDNSLLLGYYSRNTIITDGRRQKINL